MADPPRLQIHQGHSLGPFVLGASIHDILARVKSLPLIYPSIELAYSQGYPVVAPIVISLPPNGLRLRFDGPEQRLRLIEVLDFSKLRLIYDQEDLAVAQTDGSTDAPPPTAPHASHPKAGPSFRRVYNRFGPTTPGEYIEPSAGGGDEGTYVLSYPGIAFSFPLQTGAWAPSLAWASTVSLLSSTATGAAASLAVFAAKSWPAARASLYSPDDPSALAPASLRSPVPPGLRREQVPREVERARVWGRGRVELVRRDAPSCWVVLGETTPQDLVTELGPPDSIHRKSDRRVSIHRARKGSSVGAGGPRSRRGSSNSEVHHSPGNVVIRGLAPLDSDLSSHGESSDSEEDGDEVLDDSRESASEQVFYNYYSHGFDILISTPTKPSTAPPAAPNDATQDSGGTPMPLDAADPVLPRTHLTATKILLHGNVPGSWAFNRHRRLRWTLESIPSDEGAQAEPLTSERHWRDIQTRLQAAFRGLYAGDEEERAASLPMVVNRGWGREEFGVDAEWGVVGGWEDGASAVARRGRDDARPGEGDQERMGAAEVYGFPGLVFEVLKNGAVSCLMVY